MLVMKVLCTILFAFVPCVINEYSQNSDMNSSIRFASKTPYLFKEQKIIHYDDYTPKKIWAIFRHGTRFPGKKIISKYSRLIDHIQSIQTSDFLTNDEKVAFKNWKPLEISLSHQKYLTKEGEEELFKLGQRFGNRFLKYFNAIDTKFTFKHTPTQRTNVSARKFIDGLFQNTSIDYELIEVARDDIILRPYKGCQLWLKNIKKNPNALAEKKILIESLEVENLINEIRDITRVRDLVFQDVELIYAICGFETAWRHQLYNGKSIWCSLFKNQSHLDLLEYLRDMEYYWIDGPGFEITKKIACNTVKDMIEQLDPNSNHQSLSFYFTHSGTILKLLTFLELYEDDIQMTADKFNYHHRLWRTSIIDTFSTNIIVVLYDSKKYGPHIQFLHQENVIQIPKCKSNEHGMCSYDEFKELYEAKINDCNIHRICNKMNDEL